MLTHSLRMACWRDWHQSAHPRLFLAMPRYLSGYQATATAFYVLLWVCMHAYAAHIRYMILFRHKGRGKASTELTDRQANRHRPDALTTDRQEHDVVYMVLCELITP